MIQITRKGESGLYDSHATDIINKAAEIEFVECVEGKPYSSEVEVDILRRCTGGDNGLGRHMKS